MAQKKKVTLKKSTTEKKAPSKKPVAGKAKVKRAGKATVKPKAKTAPKPKPTVRPKTKTAAKPKPTVKPKTKTAAKPKATVKPKAKTAAEKMEVKKKTVAKSVSKKAAKQKATPAKALKAASKTTGKAPASQSQVVPSPARSKTAKDDVVAAEAQATGQRRQSGANLKFLVSVAQAIKDAVAPIAKAVKGREVVDEAPSGDVTFLLDRVAEKALFTRLKAAALPIAYYSEHEGYSTFSSKAPKALLIVDPIDGTRAAKSGFEGCVVAVASTRVIERPTIADVDCACVMDLLGDRIFLAERGKGARVYVGGRLKRPKLSDNIDLESMIWSMTIPARPAELVFPTAARIIDLSSLKGGFFACNSTSFSLTRLVTSQLDACVDIANRYYRDIPDRVEDYFINAGRGKVIGVAPYDIAASLLIAREAGCIVTDAYGKNFDDLLLLDSSKGNHQSIIAASNEQLHEKLLSFFDTRIRQYELLLTRHTSGE